MFETQNKNVIRRLAKADLRSKKMGNLFILITLTLAACLLMVMGLFPGTVKVDMQRKLEKAQDVMYMAVNQEQIDALKKDSRLSFLTLDKLGERMEIDDYMIWHVYFDGTADEIQTNGTPAEGKLPEKEDEVLVSESFMKKLGKEARVGEKITVPRLSGKKEVYTVSGFYPEVKNTDLFSIVHSKKYAEAGGLKDTPYDVLAKVEGASDMTQPEFLQVIRVVAQDAGISRSQVNENNNFLFTLPEGKMTAESVGIGIIGFVILAAGVMVIYSIFYISISGKTREYGQLRTLGMTKKQVKKLVKCQGRILAMQAIPAGLVLGGLISWLIKPNGFSIVNTLAAAVITAAVILLTVLVSVMKPAKMAASISPMEAARYSAYQGDTGKKETKKLQRKITPLSLARMNSVRNRKKTFMTMLSLGIGGILFIAAVTFAVSMDADRYSRQGPYELGEFVIDFSENASETAREGRAELQLKNPFNEELKGEIEQIPGVEKVYDLKEAYVKYDYNDQEGRPDLVTPFSESEAKELEGKVEEGDFDYEGLLSGSEILVRNNDQAEEIYGWRFKVGDEVTVHYYDGGKKTRTYRIGGCVEGYKDGITDGWFLLPEEVVKETLPNVDLSGSWVVKTDPEMTDKVEEQLEGIVEQKPELSMDTLREKKIRDQDVVNEFKLMVVALVMFVVLFSMINLVNTLISNFSSEKMELAMFQSIEMTGSQIRKLVLGEGLVLASGNVVLSLIFGSLLGYGVCRFMNEVGEVNYMVYQFPLLYSLLYIAVVLLVPCIIGLVMICRFRSRTLVERLREI